MKTRPLNILALDTATAETCGCLLSGSRTYMASLGADQRIRSTGIMPMLAELLQQAGLDWQNLDILAFSQGPGSFTGLRIAAATLAGLNAELKLPVLHMSSLAITARQTDSQGPIWILEDARAGEAFVGCYDHGEAVSADCCMCWQDIVEQLAPATFTSLATPPLPLNDWHYQPVARSRAEALADELLHASRSVSDHRHLPIYPSPAYLQLSQAERSAHAR
ncbi:tRNA (adenosine(37)-N6)-threonylcarbamoyltransferase complex dimerization subunit type 1 TsaB [Mariprofundus erugo]|uniref:tRNA (adenosine(37)-N6)-threonylcarbamoyltransferase complex dimerization subunit type 1 TsaB n=1 Tax=Mariprofundus erugo TaxID=2528639 RepID=UPI0019311282|nr:tRNA (adenosine(37)-N6)-threonylcarbamoyltransferase complex dimerization subunit type 1 TsaB [Mariprofundus erugo]